MKRYLKARFMINYTDGGSFGIAVLKSRTKIITRRLIDRVERDLQEGDKGIIIQNIVKIY